MKMSHGLAVALITGWQRNCGYMGLSLDLYNEAKALNGIVGRPGITPRTLIARTNVLANNFLWDGRVRDGYRALRKFGLGDNKGAELAPSYKKDQSRTNALRVLSEGCIERSKRSAWGVVKPRHSLPRGRG